MQVSQSTGRSLWLTKTPPSVANWPLQASVALRCAALRACLERDSSGARGADDGAILKEGESWS